MVQGVGLQWNLALAMAVGVWLMCTRLTLDARGAMADADHLMGSLAVTIAVIACAEPARPVASSTCCLLGAALLVTPWVSKLDGAYGGVHLRRAGAHALQHPARRGARAL